MHSDYHTPEDDIEKINFVGLHNIAKLSVLLIEKLGDENVKLSFLQDQQSQQVRHGGEMKVKLGIMPDMTSRNSDGLGVDGVTAGGVAEKAGIVKGDKIVELDGMKIGGIYEYMNAMSGFEQGQTVKGVVERNGEKLEVELNF
ncbi:MAG: PDZ domain-containing protein [Bacteroidales bacterium]|nr:PDZ domain-containing protein [Bacteroidales bacterium]